MDAVCLDASFQLCEEIPRTGFIGTVIGLLFGDTNTLPYENPDGSFHLRELKQGYIGRFITQ